MRKRKPAPVPAEQQAILADLRARHATDKRRAVEPAPAWSANALNRLHGRGLVAKAEPNRWWLTRGGPQA